MRELFTLLFVHLPRWWRESRVRARERFVSSAWVRAQRKVKPQD